MVRRRGRSAPARGKDGRFVKKDARRGRAGVLDLARALAPILLAPGMKAASYGYDRLFGSSKGKTMGKAIVKYGKANAPVTRYNTTGFAGKFAKPRKVRKMNKFMTHGCTRKQETGGTVTGNKCVYLGHSTANYAEEHLVVWMAIARALLSKIGKQVRSVNDGFEIDMTVTYYKSSDSTAEQQSVSANGVLTLQSIKLLSIKMQEALYGKIKADGDHDFVLDRVSLIVGEGGQEAPSIDFNLRSMKLSMSKTNVLRMQNKTRAGPTGVAEDLANDIENNPLKGLVYQGNNGGLIPQLRPEGALAQWVGFVPSGAGLIGAMEGPIASAILNKPPNPSYFRRCRRYGSVYLAPGQIKSSVVKDNFTTTVANWMATQRRIILELGSLVPAATVLTRSNIYRGNCKVYAFEKQLDTRSTDDLAADIQIGYQLNTKTQAVVYCKNTSICVEDVDDFGLPVNFNLA